MRNRVVIVCTDCIIVIVYYKFDTGFDFYIRKTENRRRLSFDCMLILSTIYLSQECTT